MKLKQRPQDFRVVERIRLPILERGPYAVFRLHKRHIGTFEAVGELARRWGLPRSAVGFCGLKDTHAEATQYLTVRAARPRPVEAERYRVEPVGRAEEPLGPPWLEGNEFEITVRDLSPEDAEDLRRSIHEVRACGLPNYFDEQRFGSVRSGQFVGRRVLDGDFEGALRLALAAPSPVDTGRRHAIRRILADRWGKWDECLAALPRSSERSVVAFLRDHPVDFRRAFALLDRHLRFLYLSAYQSHLWNGALAALLGRLVPEEARFDRRLGTAKVPFHRRLEPPVLERLRALAIPLPSRKMAASDPEVASCLDGALAADGLAPGRLRVRGLKDTYFAVGARRALVLPKDLALAGDEPDALNPRRRAATFRCLLPPGSYATLLVRRTFGTWRRGQRID